MESFKVKRVPVIPVYLKSTYYISFFATRFIMAVIIELTGVIFLDGE
jgi:hypothetical protein